MKLYINSSNENWICDRLKKEFDLYNHVTVDSEENSDIIWLIAPWQWRNIPIKSLQSKKVVATIHHIVPEKFDDQKIKEFQLRDRFVNFYHAPCEKTKQQIQNYTNKKIVVIPFWVNQNIWYGLDNKEELRKKYNIPTDKFAIGSFQRDTEGHDLKSPKLEKGPDIFCDIVEDMYEKNSNLHVVLAGWRRQYIINRLTGANIPYTYHELPSFKELNEMYNCLDLYLVSARYEGGPQAIVECAANRTPIISTDVGLASDILPQSSLYGASDYTSANPDVDTAYSNVKRLFMPAGFVDFMTMFKDEDLYK